MPNTRTCLDCSADLAFYNGNCIRCYACRAIRRREIFNKADKRRRRRQGLLPAAAKPGAAPQSAETFVVHHRVTAKQVAAYMQAYAPKSYNQVVRRVQELLTQVR